MNNWQQLKLIDVADIKLSNVDKKTKPGERTIKLCNYTDVYKNSFINSDKSEDFMVASCKDTEYEKFVLRKGQVAITKDSEKPDDIGIPTYIAEDFEDVVLGYHLSLITPDENKLDGRFLNYWLNTKHAKRYFENNAGGSGQRCTLILDTIKSIPLHLPELEEQKKIAKVLSDLDAKIEVNNKINQELEALAKTIYDYWFVQFDFPNQYGKPYKSSGGKMVYNEQLKREIPEGWKKGVLVDIAKIVRGVSYNKHDIKTPKDENVTPVLRATNITGNVIDLENMVYVPDEFVSEKQLMSKYDVLITMSSGSKDHIGKNGMFYFDKKVAFGAFCAKLKAKENYQFFLSSYMQSEFISETIKKECLGTSINNLNGSLVKGFRLVKPSEDVLKSFNKKMKPIHDKIGNNQKENQKLASLRDWLLPMLMNGQVRVGEEKAIYKKENILNMVVVKPVSSDAVVIGTHIIKELVDSQGMGRTKFQKVLHLGEYYCEKKLGGIYTKNAAGPHNDVLIRTIEGKIRNLRHIDISTDIVNGKKHYVYKTTPRTVESESIYKTLPEDLKARLDYLIEVLKPLSLKETEAISTLYAVWNNRIIKKLEVNMQFLKIDFYNWSERKKKEFTDLDISEAFNKMKLKNIMPNGWGDYIS